jgi:hypothetical protein
LPGTWSGKFVPAPKPKEPAVPVSALRALLRKADVEIIELRYLLAALCDQAEKP